MIVVVGSLEIYVKYKIELINESYATKLNLILMGSILLTIDNTVLFNKISSFNHHLFKFIAQLSIVILKLKMKCIQMMTRFIS